MSKKSINCTTCDDTGIAVYPLRLRGDCDAGKSKPKTLSKRTVGKIISMSKKKRITIPLPKRIRP